MERKDLIPELSGIRPGDHISLLYHTESEREDVVLWYLRDGLGKGEKVICVGGEETLRCIREGLESAGLDVSSLADSGQLSTLDSREVYLPTGSFHPLETLRFWSGEAEKAAAAGWKSMRVAGDMSWAPAVPSIGEELARYEAEINRLPLALDCIMLCSYNLANFSPEIVLEMLRTHPKVALRSELFDNIYYLPPAEFLENMTAHSILGYHLSHLVERKRALQQIQASREYAEAIVETVREPLLVLDAGLRVITANRSFYRTFQVTPEETEGRLVYELGNRQWDIPVLRKLLEEIVPLNSHFDDYEVELDFPQIGRRTMLLNARNIYREGNRTEMILLAIEDITERKRAEEKVSKLNRMFLSLGADFLANTELVLYACRDIMEGDLAAYARLYKGKLFLLNTAPGEEGFLLCKEPSPFLGWPLLNGDHTGLLVATSMHAGESWRGDPLVKRHGFLSFLGYPVLLQDRVIGVLSIYYQIERCRPDEENLEALAILARTLAIEEERLAREESLKDFIDIASHELRHPVTLIKGYALSMLEHWNELPESETRAMLAAVDEGADRLTRLVEGLLDLSSIERGRFRMEKQEVELLPLLEKAVASTRRPEGEVVLRRRGKIGKCNLDPERFLDALAILLENARKFSPPGSPVEVEVERKEGLYIISVLDLGEGIPEEESKQVFDRFYTVGRARFHSKPGMGMGLYIAREIVERHHGKIWYEPRDGGGSIFRFTIPAPPDVKGS